MARQNASSHSKRFHIVLIPGFGGFDAIGQVEYYAGVTPLFQNWKDKRTDVELHYFDNFPTAGVVTRASRLRTYLARRLARGTIAPGDTVTLVGHSTGALDIRRLIWQLCSADDNDVLAGAPGPVQVDGGFAVSNQDLLDRIHRVVFLSAPHWGTNIADWVRAHKVWREAIVCKLRAGVAGSQFFILDWIEEALAGAAASLTDADALLAVQDALSEANACNGQRGPIRTAAAQEAASELALYLRHMASDFHVIDDLAAKRPPGPVVSPAHFDDEERAKELSLWDKPPSTDRLPIDALSFATLGGRAFLFPAGKPAPVWELTNPCTYPDIGQAAALSGADIAYRLAYRACAGGPFDWPTKSGKIDRWLGRGRQPTLELWDSDGIVNTGSMLWPRGDNILVPGDHLDIVGHYHLVPAEPGGGRAYQAYDTLRSRPPFTKGMFTRIWEAIFSFAVAL